MRGLKTAGGRMALTRFDAAEHFQSGQPDPMLSQTGRLAPFDDGA